MELINWLSYSGRCFIVILCWMFTSYWYVYIYINYIFLFIFVVKTLFPVLCTYLRKLREVNNKWIINPYCAVWSAFIRQLLLQHFCLHIGQVHCKFFTLKVVGKPIFDLYFISQRCCMLSQKRYNDCPP